MGSLEFKNKSSGEKLGFGPKTVDYLKIKSRENVEAHSNTSLLLFQIDYFKSKRNFYGEILVKEFIDPQGVKLNGVIEIVEGDEKQLEKIPNKLLKLNFSCFVDHLHEANVSPQIGDYFASKNRIYQIYETTLLDANKFSIGVDQQSISRRFFCAEVDDETILPISQNVIQSANDLFGIDQIYI